MTDEQVPGQTWNEQLAAWFSAIGKSIGEISRESGIPRTSFKDYVRGRVKDLDRLSYQRIGLLYRLTGLKCFEHIGARIPIPEPTSEVPETRGYIREIEATGRTLKQRVDQLVEQAITECDLTGRERLEAGLLKARRYSPSPEQRVDAILELLDVLSEEVDYFRTAPDSEVDVLVGRLKKEPESFGYVTQMLNVIYSGKGRDNWMLLMQPPSKTKKILMRRKLEERK